MTHCDDLQGDNVALTDSPHRPIRRLFTDIDFTYLSWKLWPPSDPEKETFAGNETIPEGLSASGRVFSHTTKALYELEKSGVEVIPCTGRSLSETRSCLEVILHDHENCPETPNHKISCFPGIYNDGLTVYDHQGELIKAFSLENALLQGAFDAILAFLKNSSERWRSTPVVYLSHPNSKTILNHPDCPLSQHLLDQNHLSCPKLMRYCEEFNKTTFLEQGDRLSQVLGISSFPQCRSTQEQPSEEVSIDPSPASKTYGSISDALHQLKEPIVMLGIIVPQDINEELLEWIRSLLPQEIRSQIEVRKLFGCGIGITLSGANKAGAISYYLEHHGQEIHDSGVIGDGHNDVPMLKLVKDESRSNAAFVMGHASESVKGNGSIIVGGIDQGGWYDAAMMVLEHNEKTSQSKDV